MELLRQEWKSKQESQIDFYWDEKYSKIDYQMQNTDHNYIHC